MVQKQTSHLMNFISLGLCTQEGKVLHSQAFSAETDPGIQVGDETPLRITFRINIM